MDPKYIGLLVILALIVWMVARYRKNLPVSERVRNEIIEYSEAVIVAGILALFIIVYVARIFFIPSESMLPTLKIRDVIIVNKAVYRLAPPKRGEIVIFRPPPKANAGEKQFIKRLIGLGGETIEVKEGKVFINGKPLNEPYIREPMYYDMKPVKIPKDGLFVMGDNRNNSDDSHIWGILPKKNLVGKAWLRFIPPWRACIFRVPEYPELEVDSQAVPSLKSSPAPAQRIKSKEIPSPAGSI
ncbi:MAG: signal peptidase I [Candidatus Eremiobacteraeota bacterium]|nr:signal peptidase I [Candidatus Eremiobacteraeota bacterium]